MNILILSWRGPGHPLSGGAEQVTYEHARGWVRAGHKVTLFTSSFPGSISHDCIDDINIIRYGDQYFGVKILAFFWYKFVNNENFDLIIDEFHGIPFFTPLYVNKKILGFIHETGTKVWALNFWTFPLNLLPTIFGPIVENLVFKFLYKDIDFLTVSNSTKIDLQRFGIQKISVIHNGVKIPDKIPRVSKNKNLTVLYLSAIAQDKGIEDAIKAFEIIKIHEPNASMLVAGKAENKYLTHLKSLSNAPKYLGYVPEVNKFKLMGESHFLIFPSFHEGWGLVVIEANSVGTPVIAYDVSGSRDSIVNNKTGVLCEVGNFSELANQIIELHKNTKKYKDLSMNAILWSKKFNWTYSCKQSLDLIESLVYNADLNG